MNTKVVKVKLIGGLGNNLFQYAAGKYLSDKVNLPLLVDANGLETRFSAAKYFLKDLHPEPKPLNFFWELLFRFRKKTNEILFSLGRSSKIFQNLSYKIFKIYYSHEVGFDKNLDRIESQATLMGYFQSWRYAKYLVNSNLMARTVTINSDWYRKMLREIYFRNPVILHVRRGDYVKLKNKIGILSKDYYLGAYESLPSNLKKSEIWVFSDDLVLAKKILSGIAIEHIFFIEPPSDSNPAEIMSLMSQGVAHIISNSTFSYWAALISERSQIVIAPSRWFKTWPEPEELLPNEWVKVSSHWES